MKPIILIDKPFPPAHQAWLADHATIFLASTAKQAELNTVQGLFWYGHDPISSSLLNSTPNLLAVSNFGAGYEHIDVPECISRRLQVGHTPDCLSECVADYAFAMLLASARDVVEGVKRCEHPSFTQFNANDLGKQVSGATIGIVGMGSIGSQVARRANFGFGMTVLYHNRNQKSPEAEASCGNATFSPSLQDLLSKSDFVVLTAPVTPETTNLMSAAQFAAMKPDSILINIGRGLLVDTPALVAALHKFPSMRCVLDVTEPEPLPRDHILVKPQGTPLEGRVIITPHAGSATSETRLDMLKMAFDNLLAGINGKRMVSE